MIQPLLKQLKIDMPTAGIATSATLVTVFTESVVQASKSQLVFPLSIDILNFCGIPEEQSTSKYNYPGKQPFMPEMYPKYGKPVYPHQAGSFESCFWLPLLQLFSILARLLA